MDEGDGQEFRGAWELGEDSDTFWGTLTIPPSGRPSLEVVGEAGDNRFELDAIKWIRGKTANGKRVRLKRCVQKGYQGSIGTTNLISKRFEADLAFIGPGFPESGEIVFDSVSAHLTNLDSLLNTHGFARPSRGEHDQAFAYDNPDPLVVNLVGGTTVSFRPDVSSRMGGNPIREAAIEQTAVVEISPNNPQDYDFYQSLLKRIRLFLSICAGLPVYVESLEGELPTPDDHPPASLDIYRNYPEYASQVPSLRPGKMSLTLDWMEPELESTLRAWIKEYERLEPVYELLYGAQFNPYMLRIHRFLSTVQALEVLHRRTYGDTDDSGNRIHLIDRLRELYDQNPEIFSNHLGNREALTERIKDTRVYHTHFLEDREPKAATGTDLSKLIEKTEAFLLGSLLSEIGVGSLFVSSVVENSVGRYEYIDWDEQ